MKIGIYGLGAIGGLLAARLAAAGHAVSAVARGDTLAAVQRNGLRLIGTAPNPQESRHEIVVAEDPSTLGVQDVVIVSVKTTALSDIAHRIAPLIGPDTTVLSAMNGVPWWFFHGMAPELASLELRSIDPDGGIARAIPPSAVVGSVVHLSAQMPQPGVVRHVAGNLLIIGEPTGNAATPRAQAIVKALRAAGFEVEEAESIQRSIWYKLWGNMTVNPVSAITGVTVDKILDDDEVRGFLSRCMLEATAVGDRIGIPIDSTPEQRHTVTRKLGAFKTSMLQDVENNRQVELDALVTAVVEIARQVNVATPNIETLLGLARLHAQARGLYPTA